MATSTPRCGICDVRHQYRPSEVWCSECDEGLCRECNEHHSLSKASRNHKTVPIDKYMKLPKYILNIKEYCTQHNEKFQTFCKKHNCPCCRVCMIQDHDRCQDKVLLEDVMHNVKTSNSFTETELLIEEILISMNEIYKDRKSNVDNFAQQKEQIDQTISEKRTRVNNHLDKIEEALKKDIAATETSIIAKNNQLVVSLDKKKEEVVGHQKTLINIKKYATDLQTFCALNQIQDDIQTKDQYLHSLVEDGQLDRNYMSIKTNSIIDKVFVSIQQFGEVIMESRPSTIKITRSKDKQAQMMVVAIPTKSIDTIRATLRQKIRTKLSNVRGCLLLPNDTMAFSCYSQDVIRIISKDGSELSDIKTGTTTFDMVYMEARNSIAVTSRDGKRCITMIDNDSKQIKTTIPVKSDNYGITFRDDNLYFCAHYKGLRMVNLRDSSVCDVGTHSMASFAYVTTFNDKLYYTNHNHHTVTCCDLQGHIQWEFKDEGILKSPYGIDVDRHGNIYVVGNFTNNVVVISPEGKQCRQLLSQTDGLNCPLVLNFDKTKSKLLVANLKSDAVLCDIFN